MPDFVKSSLDVYRKAAEHYLFSLIEPLRYTCFVILITLLTRSIVE